MINYALQDAEAIFTAFLAFSILIFPIGYVLGQYLNPWQFRQRTLTFQLPASICLSVSTAPIFTFLLANWRLAWLAYLLLTVAAAYLLYRTRPAIKSTLVISGFIAIGWAVFAAAWLLDWQFKSRVYFPFYAFDYSTRSAFVHSLAVFGLPAQNPFFNPGHPIALHYHFLWLLQCALVHALSPAFLTARTTIIASALWIGIALMCICVLAIRILFQRRSYIVLALLTVSGLDAIEAVFPLFPDHLRLVGLLHTALWQPHYIAALIACVTGFLLVWQSSTIPLTILAGACFATAVGSGSFVALIFAAFLFIWAVLHPRQWRTWTICAIAAILFSLPYLLTLRNPAQNVNGPKLLTLALTPSLLQLLTIPANYALQLGFFAACVIVGYRRKLTPPERALMLMALVSVLICTLFQSGATPNNDLGWRGFLVAQFALLLLSASYLHQSKPANWLKALIFLGVLCTGYELFLNRFFPILSDQTQGPKPDWLGADNQLGERTRAHREAYAWLAVHSNPADTLGLNPDVRRVDIFSGLYADRNIVAGDRTCTIGFGGTPAECQPVESALTEMYKGETDFATACSHLSARFYVVNDTDPVWRQTQSWAWTRPPAFANQFVRIFECLQSNQRPNGSKSLQTTADRPPR